MLGRFVVVFSGRVRSSNGWTTKKTHKSSQKTPDFLWGGVWPRTVCSSLFILCIFLGFPFVRVFFMFRFHVVVSCVLSFVFSVLCFVFRSFLFFILFFMFGIHLLFFHRFHICLFVFFHFICLHVVFQLCTCCSLIFQFSCCT